LNTTPLDGPDNGVVVLNPDGSYTYTPDPGFSGEDQFTYEVCDDGTPSLCDTATVYIEVIPEPNGENRPPIANPDANQTEEDTPVSGDLLSNDSDPDGDNLIINTTPIADPENGTVTINGDGTYTYTPDSGFIGQDEFVYEVCDDGIPSLCDSAIVVIDVLPDGGGNSDENNTFAHDDAAVTNQDTPVSGNVSANDFDPEGDNQTVNTTPVSGPSNGMVVLSSDGSFTYTPDPGFSGNDFFTYETCDDGTPQACDVATVSIAVMACPKVSVKVLLEGAYDTMSMVMTTDLNYFHVLPGQDPDESENIGAQIFGVAAPPGQPYDTAPWNWSGTEGDNYGDGAGDIPYDTTVTDWVLVSVREADSLATSEVWKCAGLLHSDGTVEFPEECDCANALVGGNKYYIVVEHRNHLPVMSNVQTMTGNTLSYDFTQNQSWIYEIMGIPVGSGQKLIEGRYWMYAGNSEQLSARVDINSSDDAQWIADNGSIFAYRAGDHNLNGDTNSSDEFIWIINNSTFTLLPF
jgi:hypothetical protein